MNGNVFNIQRFSVHDGPGIRTTVFLKGCNNRCQWCHNPESLDLQPQLQFFSDRCIQCQQCLTICENGVFEKDSQGKRVLHRELCRHCGECTRVCYAGALEIAGREMSMDEVMDEILKDRVYYDSSGGGVTFSGGEPVLQREFLQGLLQRCKEQKLHTTIQTAGNYPWEWLEALLPWIDFVMYDLKAFDKTLHQRYTGTDNGMIFSNLRALAETKKEFAVRTPVIAGVNDTVKEIECIADMICSLPGLLYYELIPYHSLGVSKNQFLGNNEVHVFSAPSAEQMGLLAEAAKKFVSDVRHP